MPPNANTNTEEQLPEESTQGLEADNQKAEETTQGKVFPELAQKMFTEATTLTPKTTTEAEGKTLSSRIYYILYILNIKYKLTNENK